MESTTQSPSKSLISFCDVALGYGHVGILKNINLEVMAGDFIGIVGPNGAGKTTLLKAILGLLKPQSGQMSVSSEGLRIGYVPQRDSVDTLFPLTVLDIVLMGRYTGLSAFGRPGKTDREAAMCALEHVGITNLANRAYPSLSGGQKQRALIARALVGGPNLLILDEPTNGMDLASETAIMELVSHLHRDDGLTVLMVSHLLNMVVNYVRHVAIVGDGTLVSGSLDELITTQRLGGLYHLPIKVVDIEGHRVILPPLVGQSGLEFNSQVAQ